MNTEAAWRNLASVYLRSVMSTMLPTMRNGCRPSRSTTRPRSCIQRPVLAQDAEFATVLPGAGERALQRGLPPLPILGIKLRLKILEGTAVLRQVDAEQFGPPCVMRDDIVPDVPIPQAFSGRGHRIRILPLALGHRLVCAVLAPVAGIEQRGKDHPDNSKGVFPWLPEGLWRRQDRCDPPQLKKTPEIPAIAREELRKMGPMSLAEKILALDFVLLILLWIKGGHRKILIRIRINW